MPFQVSPGVNVSEIDLTTVIPAISTSTGGIAGHFRWGPVQKRILIDSEDTLVAQFQAPNANTAADFFTAANFLAYTNALFVVRVIDTSGAGANGRNSITAAANTADTLIENDDDYNDNFTNGITGVGEFVAKYPGQLGNSLKVSVCQGANAWESTITSNITVTANSTAITGVDTSESGSGTASAFLTELVVGDLMVLGSDKQIRRVSSIANNSTLTLETKYTGNSAGAFAANSTNFAGVSTPTRRWEFYKQFDIAPGTSDYANTQGGTSDEIHIAVVDEDGEWTGAKQVVIERFEKVSLASDAKTDDGSTNYYKEIINQQSKFLWWTAHHTNNTGAGSKALGKDFTVTGTNSLPQTSSLVNGRDGNTPPNSDYNTGFNKFNNPEDVDIAFLLGAAANQTRAVHIIDNVASVRLDSLAVLSPRNADVVNNSGYEGSEMDDVIAFRNILPSTSYAVMDSGWKYQYDKYNDLFRYVPLNGDTAGTMARTDSVRDPWFSPAGFNRGQIKNVVKLAYNPKKAQRNELYKAGVNPVVSFPGQGTVLFGDKTLLAKPSAFDRINVRRLFIVLEKAISTAAKFTLFEFNDEFTRAQFRNLVEPFLRDVQGRRGIFDFRVVVDETNNTAEVIDRNEFIGDIYIKPARSINFIQLNFVAVRTGVDFSEIVGQFG